ncbi:MAG: hypothetical protein ACI9KE_000816 [Polyangiales bacterium]|jgi:hypothetical protein
MLGRAARPATLEEALQLYNNDTVARGEQLFQRSRAAARAFAPEGRPIPSPQRLLRDLIRQAALEISGD